MKKIPNPSLVLVVLCAVCGMGCAQNSSDCNAVYSAFPNKVGDMNLTNKTCTVVTPELAKTIRTHVGIRAEMTYKSAKADHSLTVALDEERHDTSWSPGQMTELVNGQKNAENTLQQAAASGIPEFVKSYRDLRTHSRVVGYSDPEFAILHWHDEVNTAEVYGVVNQAYDMRVNMTAASIDEALNTLAALNAGMKYAALP